jgi:hypothetical protein
MSPKVYIPLSLTVVLGVLWYFLLPTKIVPKDTLFETRLAQMSKRIGGYPQPDIPTDKTKTWCAMQCGDVPFAGFKCVMVCVTCTDEYGGGCALTIY